MKRKSTYYLLENKATGEQLRIIGCKTQNTLLKRLGAEFFKFKITILRGDIKLAKALLKQGQRIG